MKTFVGIDYHKAFSYGTIVSQSGEILKQGRFGNHPEALARFLDEHAGPDCAAVLEATRNWCVMHDWLEELTGQVTLAHPLKVKAIAEAKIKTDKILANRQRDRRHPPLRLAQKAARLRRTGAEHLRQWRADLPRTDHQVRQQVPAVGNGGGGMAGDAEGRRPARLL